MSEKNDLWPVRRDSLQRCFAAGDEFDFVPHVLQHHREDFRDWRGVFDDEHAETARGSRRGGGRAIVCPDFASVERGSDTVNSLTRPRPGLSAPTVPPCSSTSPLTRASPNPSPPRLRSRLLSA